MKKKEINWDDVLSVAIVALLAVAAFAFFGFMLHEATEYDRWYSSLSAEEQLEVYQANISTYEVVGVSKYVRVDTNSLGGIIDTDICYTFEYIDGDGNLKSIDNFEHHDGGLTKVAVGDVDAYVVNRNGETTRTLQLTKETLKNMQTLSSG